MRLLFIPLLLLSTLSLATDKAGAHTTTDSAVAVATGWNKISISVTSSTISVSINNVANSACNAMSTTNLPVVVVDPILRILKSAGTTAVTFDIDYFYLYHFFATAL